MDLDSIRIFDRVAELQSFTQAAEQLNLTKSRVSTVVQQLEQHIGTRLLQRTTRQVRLTTDGERFLDGCKALLNDAEQLKSMFQPAASGLHGSLRIELPTTLARDVVMPQLPEFLALHPLLEVGISTSDHLVDLVKEGFDCVVRVGALADTGLIARPLGMMAMCNLASPAYLSQHGTPHTLADLAQHQIIHYASKLGTQGAGWEYQIGPKRVVEPMRCALVVNGADAYEAACVAGLGLIQAPAHGVQTLVNQGLLVKVMPDVTAAPMPVSLLYPHRKHMAPRVSACVNWLAQVIEPYLAQAGQ